MSGYLDNVFDALGNVSWCSERLTLLSEALLIVGNERLSEELSNLSAMLHNAATDTRRAVAKEVNDEYQSTNQSIGKTLGMLLDRSAQEVKR